MKTVFSVGRNQIFIYTLGELQPGDFYGVQQYVHQHFVKQKLVVINS